MSEKRKWRSKVRRGWFVIRDRDSEVGEGSDAARTKAMLLAECADAELIDTFIKIVTLLDAAGGKCIIGAKRLKFDPRTGAEVPEDEVGVHETIAYVAQYDVAPVRGEPDEPDTTFADAEASFERATAPEEEPVPA